MKRPVMLFVLIACVVFIFSGCKEKKGCTDPISINYDPDAEEDDGTCTYAGTGGNTTLIAKPEHHGFPIVGMTGWVDSAFIKFNTHESPGISASSYDLAVPGEVDEDHVRIAGLKPGKYFIMMTGWDSAYNQRVAGGIPFTLTQTSGVLEMVVPVTE